MALHTRLTVIYSCSLSTEVNFASTSVDSLTTYCNIPVSCNVEESFIGALVTVALVMWLLLSCKLYKHTRMLDNGHQMTVLLWDLTMPYPAYYIFNSKYAECMMFK